VEQDGPHRPLRVSMMGTRGVPAHYGGFETAIEEIGKRLVERGIDVTVYCRKGQSGPTDPTEHLGMRLVTLPAWRTRALETLSHAAISSVHATLTEQPDVVFLFNSANSVLLPLLRARRVPVAVHVDGLEWRRSKWSGAGQRYYRVAETLAVRWADALIADAPGIADYYRDEFDARCELLTYGAPVLRDQPADRLAELGLVRDGFHLIVARFEPENNLELMVRGFRASAARLPLVVVGGAPYGDSYTKAVRAAAGSDPRIHLVGPLWEQDLLDQLYANARLYLHGHSVGGTNPSLLRAMGAGTAVSAYDVAFNRQVLGLGGWLFADEASLASSIEAAEAQPSACASYGQALQARAEQHFQWDDVASGYEQLARRLAGGETRRGETTGRRRNAPEWARQPARWTPGRRDDVRPY
jgi:glycosyltransferase involved in cell wall biosynthesis